MKIAKVRLIRPTLRSLFIVPRPLLNSEPSLERSMLSVPRMFHFLGSRLLRSTTTLVSNYLVPTAKLLTSAGLQFVRAQVHPRVFTTVAALINPAAPRFQQREVTIIVIPLILSPPNSNNNDIASPDEATHPHSPPLRPEPPHDTDNLPPPTFVTPYPAIVRQYR